jgi:hypothetical protein
MLTSQSGAAVHQNSQGIIMRLKICALAIAALGASGLAQAEAAYSAGFTLTNNFLPPLATGTGLDNPNYAYAGTWTGVSLKDARVDTQDLLSSTRDPVSGNLIPTWGNAGHSDNMHRAGGPGMGESHAHTPSGFYETHGESGVYPTGLGAEIRLQKDAGKGKAQATWQRDFSLNAYGSFTFSGLAKVGITDPLNTPLSASTSFLENSDKSFASLTLADAADRVRTSISASLFGLTGIGSGIFSYATDPSGLLSLTVTNPFATAINGTLQAGTFVDVTSLPGGTLSLASPVPEPSTYLTMVLGLGIVGAMTRRKAKRASASPAPALAG